MLDSVCTAWVTRIGVAGELAALKGAAKVRSRLWEVKGKRRVAIKVCFCLWGELHRCGLPDVF